MSMKLVVMGSCRRVYKVEDCEVLDDRRRQGAFTISLMVKALRESHRLGIVITKRTKVFVIQRAWNVALQTAYTVKWKIHKVSYFLSLSKVSFVSALLKLASEYSIVHELPPQTHER